MFLNLVMLTLLIALFLSCAALVAFAENIIDPGPQGRAGGDGA